MVKKWNWNAFAGFRKGKILGLLPTPYAWRPFPHLVTVAPEENEKLFPHIWAEAMAGERGGQEKEHTLEPDKSMKMPLI